MKTVHHIESPEEVIRLFSSARVTQDRFPYVGKENLFILIDGIRIADFRIEFIGPDCENYQMNLSYEDAMKLIEQVFSMQGIDLRIQR